MTFFRLLLRNLHYHWRGNLAVFLGVALGTAVLTGALLVGDSLRGSLESLTLDQLGWVSSVMVPNRFFTDALASNLNPQRDANVDATPALPLPRIASPDCKPTPR